MKTMQRSCRLILVIALLLGVSCPALAAAAPGGGWGRLLDVTYKFSWYPRPDLQKLLKLKGAEYGQSLEAYRQRLLAELSDGGSRAGEIRPEALATGKPWRTYLRLSLAEFCLYLADEKPIHLQNARATLSLLDRKTDQPEVEFWRALYNAHQACLEKNRSAFIQSVFGLWQQVLLRLQSESLLFPERASQAGFVTSLPYLYENLAELILRKAILEQKIPDLYPLVPVVLDIQSKMTVKNGYRPLVDQVAERMHGPSSDNKNLNFAVALLEATTKRYAFEDEKDPDRLPGEFAQVSRYYRLAYRWADTAQGKAAILTRDMGFLNGILRRFGDRPAMWKSNGMFSNLPDLANDQLTKATVLFTRLGASEVQKRGGAKEGFESPAIYLRSLHQLWDATAKLAIALSDFYQAEGPQQQATMFFGATKPLERYCRLFARFAPANPDILPDSAYFLTAFAAKELGALYRKRARFSLDGRDDALAFAYQLEAAELFPLDLPGILQLAFQASRNGQVRQYFRYTHPLADRLRTSTEAADWDAGNPTEFDGMIALIPTAIPKVIDNPYVLLKHLPAEALSEDDLFTRAVAQVESSKPRLQKKRKRLVAAVGGTTIPGDPGSPPDRVGTGVATRDPAKYPFFKLKNRLYGAPDQPLHHFLRALFNQVPYKEHPYVALLAQLHPSGKR